MMTKKEKKRVPELRFAGFEGEWEEKKLGKLTSKVGSGSTPRGGVDVYTTTGIPFIRSQNVLDNQLLLDETHIPESVHERMAGSTVLPNDVLLNITGGSIGRSCVVPSNGFSEGNVNQHVSIIRLKKDSPHFLQALLSSHRGQNLIYQGMTGSGREGLNFQSIRGFKINIPKPEEQQKIATFLTSIDTRLQHLEKKKTLLEQYKKGVMQKIFSQEIRFRRDDGEEFGKWEEKRLGDYLNHKSKRNKKLEIDRVLSVSNSRGFILQSEQFDNHRVASKDVSNYKIVNKGDIAYNPSRINVGSIATLKDFEVGIVSPMYIVFSLKNTLNSIFFENLIDTHLFKHLVKIGCSGSVRDSLNFEDLESFTIKTPCLAEQTKIAQFLSALDRKIAAMDGQIEKTKEWKKGLLQRMFV